MPTNKNVLVRFLTQFCVQFGVTLLPCQFSSFRALLTNHLSLCHPIHDLHSFVGLGLADFMVSKSRNFSIVYNILFHMSCLFFEQTENISLPIPTQYHLLLSYAFSHVSTTTHHCTFWNHCTTSHRCCNSV
jgi:hypothetical protein